MSTLALEGSSGAGAESGGRGPAAARFLDLLVLALALPVFLLAGFPMLGYAVCGGAWLAGRAIHLAAERRAKAALVAGRRKAALGTMGAATLGRVWLVALAILIVGLGDHKAGLAGALLAAALVTAYFAGQGIAYLLEPEEAA